MSISVLLLGAGFLLLIKGADFLVKGASAVARKLHISELVIGLTVVAFGTSTPELFVNIISVVNANTDIAVGNVMGSNIANVFLILGVSALICPLNVTRGTVWKEIPMSLLAALVLAVLSNDRWIDGREISILSRIDGLVLLSFFSIFLYYSFSIAKQIEGMADHVPSDGRGLYGSIFLVILGLAGLGLGGKWIVTGAVTIAGKLGISESVIGLTVVAVGTSLPELATSAVAAYRKNVEIAVGNVVGSNIFNVFFVLGISAVVKPLPCNRVSGIDMGVVVLSSLLLFLFMFTGKRHALDRWEGAFFVASYFLYVGYLIVSN